jgi:hypothetical protein
MKRRPPTRATARFLPLLAVFLASTLFAASAARGEDPPLTVGSKVRLRTPAIGRVRGVVIEVKEAFLHVHTDDQGSVRVPRETISELEVSAGRRRRAMKGMLIGAAIGGAVSALGEYVQPGRSMPSSDRAEVIGAGVASGATIGAATGFFIKSERWRSVPLERVRLSVAPRRKGGISLSLSVTVPLS